MSSERLPYRFALVAIVLAVVGGLYWMSSSKPATTSGAMPQGVYVWQQRWKPELLTALSESGKKFDTIYVLASEMYPTSGAAPLTLTPDVKYAYLASLKKPVCLVVRVGNYAGPFDADARMGRQLLDAVRQALSKARTAGLQPSEIQIDFDCAESKLSGYRKWMQMLASAKLGVKLSFTSLPSWLDNCEFKKLAAAADEFVLQIHSFQQPSAGECSILCSRTQAERWIWRAAGAGKPFRVALPTYSHLAAFDKNGKFIGLSAEGPLMKWPADATVKRVDSPADKLAAMVTDWQKCRPANMKGLIWFRLPTSLDTLNFPQTTLNEIMKGRTPAPKLSVQITPIKRKSKNSDNMVTYDVSIKNSGTFRGNLPQKIVLSWRDGDCLVADGLNGYSISSRSSGKLEFKEQVENDDWVQPGDAVTIGWLRLPPHVEVKHEIIIREQK